MLTVRNLFNEMMLLLGVDNPDYSSESLRAQVLSGIQAELQVMQACGEDFYCREQSTLSISAGTSAYTMGKNIQRVLEPVRFSATRPLTRLESREQFDDFGPFFLGQTSRTVASGTPLAFLVESLAETDSGSLPDSVRIVLRLAPTPDSGGTLSFDCIREPPLYDAEDLCEDIYPPVPHAYHESILLPLCRKNAASSPYFKRHVALLPQIEADYARALAILGLADPRTPKPASSGNRLPVTSAAPS